MKAIIVLSSWSLSERLVELSTILSAELRTVRIVIEKYESNKYKGYLQLNNIILANLISPKYKIYYRDLIRNSATLYDQRTLPGMFLITSFSDEKYWMLREIGQIKNDYELTANTT